MISDELRQYAVQCASNVKPIPLGEKQIELLIKRMNKSADPEATLLDKLAKHNKYWSDRYGLNDAKPFAMLCDIVMRASWQGDVVNIEFVDQQPVKISNCKDVKKLLSTFASKYKGSIILQDLADSGQLDIYGQAYPQHDWHHYCLAMERLADRKVMKKLVKQYRAGTSTAKTIGELSQLIIGYSS